LRVKIINLKAVAWHKAGARENGEIQADSKSLKNRGVSHPETTRSTAARCGAFMYLNVEKKRIFALLI
jgi:hypothetical protein